MAEIKAFVVGGAVRDALLGRASTDKDWVVVGATPEQMIEARFIPVGRDFPVFLHPQTKQEYALARTERKTGPGYHGFTFHADASVTLEQDLARRDLTINAMAFDASGTLVDPHGGQRDLKARVLRHVSSAFAEDSVRILRLARFAARLHDFTVAPETLALARRMVESGEVDALVPERVWQELACGLMEARPSRMLRVLRDCGALARLVPEVDRLWDRRPDAPDSAVSQAGASAGDLLLRTLDISAQLGSTLAQRFACLGHALGTDLAALGALCQRLRVPLECRELAEVTAREQRGVEGSEALDAAALLSLLERCDALRRPERFDAMLLACECIARARQALHQGGYAQGVLLRLALRAALDVDTAIVAARAIEDGLVGPGVGQAIHEARRQAIAAVLTSTLHRD